MSIQNVVAQIAVSNLKGATAWYGRLLGHAGGSHVLAKMARWRLPRGGWLQLNPDRSHAGGSSVSLVVNDLEAQRTAMASEGLEFERPAPGDASGKSTLHDPDGNRITFEQTLKPSPEACVALDLPPPRPKRSIELTSTEEQGLIASLHVRINELEARVLELQAEAAGGMAREGLTKAAERPSAPGPGS